MHMHMHTHIWPTTREGAFTCCAVGGAPSPSARVNGAAPSAGAS